MPMFQVRILRDQAQEYTQTLQSTTGTIHFCIEALKEADPAAFMQVLSYRLRPNSHGRHESDYFAVK